MVIKSKHPHAFVLLRISLLYNIMKSPPNLFYLSPQSEDVNFYFNTLSMAMRKKFPYIKEFNHL